MSPEDKITEVFQEAIKKLEKDHQERIRKIDRDHKIFMILIGVIVLVCTLIPVFVKIWRGS